MANASLDFFKKKDVNPTDVWASASNDDTRENKAILSQLRELNVGIYHMLSDEDLKRQWFERMGKEGRGL